jgi:glycosyltransferase involved in cell wall biosynthesis
MSAPVFSIVVPTYNSGRTLSTVLDSILHQDFANFEVLIIDGASKDDTLLIAKQFNDPRIRVLSEPDSGAYNAMNKGIALAKGDWVYFLGSDDKLADNNVLRKVADAITMNTCELLYGNVKMVGEASWAENGAIYDGPFTIEKLVAKNICHQAIFYKKEVFAKLGLFKEEYKVCADWDFNHRCFASVRCQYVDIIVADFFAGGISTQKNSDKFTNEDFVLNLKDYYKVSYVNRLFKNSAWIFFNVAIARLTAGQRLTSLYFLLISMHHSTRKISLVKNYVRRILSQK